MIVADRKPIDEIIGYLKDHKNILILGCNECVTVCEAGGKKEVGVLASALAGEIYGLDVLARDIEVALQGVQQLAPASAPAFQLRLAFLPVPAAVFPPPDCCNLGVGCVLLR